MYKSIRAINYSLNTTHIIPKKTAKYCAVIEITWFKIETPLKIGRKGLFDSVKTIKYLLSQCFSAFQICAMSEILLFQYFPIKDIVIMRTKKRKIYDKKNWTAHWTQLVRRKTKCYYLQNIPKFGNRTTTDLDNEAISK